ncbi:MAG: hypothetical protein J5590_05225 [Clostridia bacterium]|nr:hypothetical protein [Clostridia bacterium]
MLGWILAGIAAAAIGAIVISGLVTKRQIQEEMLKRNIEEMIITGIDRCNNVIKLEDWENNRSLEIRGDDIDYTLEEYDTICI